MLKNMRTGIKTILRHQLAVIAMALTLPAMTAQNRWAPDTVLNDRYEMTYVNQPDDYSGPVRATVIRRTVAERHVDKAVLYIHGFNDYFFQSEMGEEFNSHGYDFYAVDLRKYGRSLLPGQKMCQVRDIEEYFPDIDSALTIMRGAGAREIVMMGHSTGGLTVSCFMSRADKKDSPEVRDIRAVILNSPFLDWNLGKTECLVPAVAFIGKIFPRLRISQSGSAYSQSLLASDHGEWRYNTDWKRYNSTDVDAGWVRAINNAQHSLRGGKADITQPVLLLYSARSVRGGKWTENHNSADGVLDVTDIKRYGRELGPDVTAMRVEGGLHDLVLSAPKVREAVYEAIFSWLDRVIKLTSVE